MFSLIYNHGNTKGTYFICGTQLWAILVVYVKMGLGGTQFQSLPILCHPLFQASLESLFPPPPEGEDELRRRRRRTVSDGGHSHGNNIIDVSHIN